MSRKIAFKASCSLLPARSCSTRPSSILQMVLFCRWQTSNEPLFTTGLAFFLLISTDFDLNSFEKPKAVLQTSSKAGYKYPVRHPSPTFQFLQLKRPLYLPVSRNGHLPRKSQRQGSSNQVLSKNQSKKTTRRKNLDNLM